LKKVFNSDKLEEVKICCAFSMLRIKDKSRPLNYLLKALKDKDRNTRTEAVAALGKLKKKESITHLKRIIDDEYEEKQVYPAAEEALKNIENRFSL